MHKTKRADEVRFGIINALRCNSVLSKSDKENLTDLKLFFYKFELGNYCQRCLNWEFQMN